MAASNDSSSDREWNPFEAPGTTGEPADLLVDAYFPRTWPSWVLVYYLAALVLGLILLGATLVVAALRSAPAATRMSPWPGLIVTGVGCVLAGLVVLIRIRLRAIPPTVRFYREGIELRIRLKQRWRISLRPFPARLAWSDFRGVGVTGRWWRRRLTLLTSRLAFDPARLRGAAVPPIWFIHFDRHQFNVSLERVRGTVQAYALLESARRRLRSWDDTPPV